MRNDSLPTPAGQGGALGVHVHTDRAGPGAGPRDRERIAVTGYEQFCIQTPAGDEPGDDELDHAEWRLLSALGNFTGGRRGCEDRWGWPSNRTLGQLIGKGGTADGGVRLVRELLNGKPYRPGVRGPDGLFARDADGRWTRGEAVRKRGLVERGWVEIRPADNPTGRELRRTSKWLEWQRVRLHREAPPPGARNPSPPRGAQPLPPPGRATPPPPGARNPPEQTSSNRPLSTLNVERACGPGDPEPPPGESLTAGPVICVPHGDGNAPEPPPRESLTAGPPPPELAEVLGRYATAPPDLQAWRLFHDLVRDGVRFSLDGDALRYEVSPGRQPLSAARKACVKYLKPAIVAVFRAEAEKTDAGGPGAPADAARPAPLVKDPARIRAAVARLECCDAGDDAPCHELAEAIAGDPGFRARDLEPETTRALVVGVARDVRDGNLPVAVLAEAFEAACGKRVRNRGARFVSELKWAIGRLGRDPRRFPARRRDPAPDRPVSHPLEARTDAHLCRDR
jgi:hypothetical protein